jgi:integrase
VKSICTPTWQKIPAAGEDQKAVVFGAVDDASGQVLWHICAHKGETAFMAFLAHLAEALPATEPVVLTWWLHSAAHRLSPSSLTRYRSHVTRSIVPAIGRIRLAKLTPQPIQALYTGMLEDGYAPNTVRQMHAVLRRALGAATRLGLVPRNVATLVTVPRPARHDMHVLAADEARTLLAAVEGDRLEALYVRALTTGMRRSELLALRWTDVDLHAKSPAVHVRATLRYQNADTYFFDPPKTDKSRRRIGLSSTALQALRAHRTRQLEERLAAGVAWRDDDLVFCTPIGGALCGNHFSERDFQALPVRANLPRGPLPRYAAHVRHAPAAPRCASQGRQRAPGALDSDHDARPLFARVARHAAGSHGGNGWHSRLTWRGTASGNWRGFLLGLRSALRSNGQNEARGGASKTCKEPHAMRHSGSLRQG